MSGPALSRLFSHHAIHDASLGEAEELTAMLWQKLSEDMPTARKVAYILLEHWETRTLVHAREEEEGLYREVAQQSPDLATDIAKLSRDHELLRILAGEIRELLQSDADLQEVAERFFAMLALNRIHSREEEEHLIQKVESALLAEKAGMQAAHT